MRLPLTLLLLAVSLSCTMAAWSDSVVMSSDSKETHADSHPAGESGPYLFAYFNTGDAGESQGLQYAYSRDGYEWKKIESKSGNFLTPHVGGKLLRDPSIVQAPDGTFHMVWTTDWWKSGIGIAHSKDLLNWSEQEYLDVMKDYPTRANCWAPEITYDAKTGDFFIYWASTVPGLYPDSEGLSETFDAEPVRGVEAAHRMYVTTTKDFKTYTPTHLYFEDGYNCIDAFVVRDEVRDRYVMAIKNEELHPTPQKNIRISFSKSALGPWEKSSESISPGWVEGPALLKVGDWWLLYYDAYTRDRYEGLKTKDFENWVPITEKINMPEGMRHGTPLPISETLLQAILDQQP